jgi:DNA helicase-2/ATP-dependent DNA helicase PcrA
MPELEQSLATCESAGFVIAPAGYGKTHLIASSVALSKRRQLVLTHTYAGVNALRRKMRELAVPGGLYQIDTVASWALRLCVAYKLTSGWEIERPQSDQWQGMYAACVALLQKPFIRRVVRASYAGLYVDEYQDCSILQHGVVVALACELPCRVLGDPMQAIFDFDGQVLVDWERDVVGLGWKKLGQLETPHRWRRSNAPKIGEWLRDVRQKLEAAEPIDLTRGLPEGVVFRHFPQTDALMIAQGNLCRGFKCHAEDTVIAIHKGDGIHKARCHNLAKKTNGRFSSIEEIEGKALFDFYARLERARNPKMRLKTVIEFSKKCMTAVNINLPAPTRRGEVVKIQLNTKNVEIARAANAYLKAANGAQMIAFFAALRSAQGVTLARGDLFNRALGVLRKLELYPELTLLEAAEKYHGEFRYKGRPLGHRKLVGTTLLVKGLEFQHAIVLNAGSLSRNELYVALTRGSKSLTIISSQTRLDPR